MKTVFIKPYICQIYVYLLQILNYYEITIIVVYSIIDLSNA